MDDLRAKIQEINDRLMEAAQELVNLGTDMTIDVKITFSDGDAATKTFHTEKGTLQ